MKLLVALGVFAVIISTTTALQCYNAHSSNINYFPTQNQYINCPRSSTRCFKMTSDYRSHGNQRSISYGCDETSDSFCYGLRDGQCSNEAGVKICCCTGDLCNSAGLPLALLISSLLVFFYLF